MYKVTKLLLCSWLLLRNFCFIMFYFIYMGKMRTVYTHIRTRIAFWTLLKYTLGLGGIFETP